LVSLRHSTTQYFQQILAEPLALEAVDDRIDGGIESGKGDGDLVVQRMNRFLVWYDVSQEVHHYSGNPADNVDDADSKNHLGDSLSRSKHGFLRLICIRFLIKP